MNALNIKWKYFIRSILLPVSVGALAALLTGGGMEVFAGLEKPPLSPPGFWFPIVWTILYTFMGIASYLVCSSDAKEDAKVAAIKIYFYQLVVNFLWPVLFFDFRLYTLSFLWLLLLLVLIILTIRRFGAASKSAARLLFPYLLWVMFAGYLNLGIALLN